MDKDLQKGFLYIATGIKYVEEAIISATSCKKFNCYPIALITDTEYNLPRGLFNQVIVKKAQYGFRDKLLIQYSPFEQTIFLDTDTYIAGSLDEVFRILDFREFALHQADEGYEYEMPEVSYAMPEFNTGVIAFKLTPAVKQLIKDWDAEFDKNTEIKTDQYHLRRTLYASDVRYATFSSAYNFIIYYPNFIIQKVKVVHGRPVESLPAIAADLNHIRHLHAWRRTYYPYKQYYLLIYSNLKNKDIFKMMEMSIRTFSANVFRKLKSGFKNTDTSI